LTCFFQSEWQGATTGNMHTTTLDKQDLIASIRHQTALANRNNVTRTQAYLEFYRKHEEIHWALLAHLVSRNGGWNMTDLRGEWLPLLMDEHAIQPFFWFLERSNWLIFHDAYPQLLLYQEMKRTDRDLTSLLGPLGVSIFMQSYWKEFLANHDSSRLTRALIVNEQQYIDQRVVQKPFTLNHIFSTFAFFYTILAFSQSGAVPLQSSSNRQTLLFDWTACTAFSAGRGADQAGQNPLSAVVRGSVPPRKNLCVLLPNPSHRLTSRLLATSFHSASG